MGKARNKEGATAPLWYVSYGDMVTNMLCFFVMLFSFSTLDSPKKRQESRALDEAFTAAFSINNEKGANQWVTQGARGIVLYPKRKHNKIPKIVAKVRNLLQKVSVRDRILILGEENRVKIRIPSKVLFESGSARFKQGSEKVLEALLPVIAEMEHDIRIDGHSDDVPTASANFPSNWELSSARACAVVRFYTERFGQAPVRFSAQGYAHYRPQVENIDERAREMNRRVEIIILTWKTRPKQPFQWE